MTRPLGSALFAEAEGKFFFKTIDAQVEFVKDAAGTITHVVLPGGARHQGSAQAMNWGDGTSSWLPGDLSATRAP